MTRSRTLGVAGLLVLLLVASGGADHGRAGAAAPLTLGLESHGAAEGTPLEPVVTLSLVVTGKRVGDGARITIKGTFRGRAVAGRPTYPLLPIGGAIATHRHATGAAQRARVERVLVDVRSDSEYLRVVGSGPLVGGPVITGPGGACRRMAFRFTVRPERGTAVLHWTCRAGSDRSPPIHLDVLGPPRDSIVSRYSIVRRPCSPHPPSPRTTRAVAGTC